MKKVLIVDDERLIRDGLSKSLAGYEAEIKTAENGSEALKEIASSFYNLCFLDVHLPDINGLEVLKKIKEISSETKVVIMTAHNMSDEMKKDIEDNAFQFIGKPFDLSQIKAISELALDGNNAGSHKNERQSLRMPMHRSIDCIVVVFESGNLNVLNLRGDVVDVSSGGLGIKTDQQLQPGYMIRFTDDAMLHVGVVKWCMPAGKASYRVGIEFMKR